MSDKTKLVILSEGVLTSWLKDVVSFGVLAAMLYINFRYLGDRTSVALFIMAIWIMSMFARATKTAKRPKNKEEAIKIINKFYA